MKSKLKINYLPKEELEAFENFPVRCIDRCIKSAAF